MTYIVFNKTKEVCTYGITVEGSTLDEVIEKARVVVHQKQWDNALCIKLI